MILSNVIRLLRVWRRYRKSVQELSDLGDRELLEIGINRNEIASIAWDDARSS